MMMTLWRHIIIYRPNTKKESKVNYGLWVMMTCQCRFINCTKCPLLVGVLVMEEAVHVWERGFGKSQDLPLNCAVT